MVLLYTDGGLRKGIGAWAFIAVDASPLSVELDYHGKASGKIIHHGYGTLKPVHSSSHCEIIAAREALKWVAATEHRHKPVQLVSDSTYVTIGVLKPFHMARSKEQYRDIWMDILRATLFLESIETVHVKGHTQQTFNVFCDYMCTKVLTHPDSAGPSRVIERAVHLINASKPWRRSLIAAHR